MDKEELKRQIKLNSHSEYDKVEWGPASVYVPVAIDLIDQLDEPEKVVVPAFVAEWIEECKRGLKSLYGALKGPGGDGKLEDWLFISPNQKTFARAWLNGFTVEEKKYTVKDKYHCFLLMKNFDGEVVNAYSKVVYKNKGQLTEQEIKDYDERFMAFAVPVEEEEE